MIVKSLEHLNSLSKKVADQLIKNDCIFLIGEIGVGKTTFTRNFINYLQKKNVTLSLPLINKKKKSLIFKKWVPTDQLTQGPLGTMQPSKTQISILPQILVVPMLSFDRGLFRLGYGGGYYDKSIYILKKHFQKQKKFFITIGLAYSIQEEKKIPREKHDMKLDYIITENEVLSNVN